MHTRTRLLPYLHVCMHAVLQTLHKHGYTGPLNTEAWRKRPSFIQSFEVQNLRSAAKKTCIPLVQLMDEFEL